MKSKFKTIIAVCLLAVAMTGCQKAEKGEAGTPGTNGKDGNANVYHSAPFLINNFTYNSTDVQYTSSLNNTSITQAVVDGGVVMIYMQNGSTWIPMPINDGTSTLMYDFHLGGITIYFYNNNGSTPTNPNGLFTIRSIVIPPAIIKSNPNIDLTNYGEVKQTLNLKD